MSIHVSKKGGPDALEMGIMEGELTEQCTPLQEYIDLIKTAFL